MFAVVLSRGIAVSAVQRRGRKNLDIKTVRKGRRLYVRDVIHTGFQEFSIHWSVMSGSMSGQSPVIRTTVSALTEAAQA